MKTYNTQKIRKDIADRLHQLRMLRKHWEKINRQDMAEDCNRRMSELLYLCYCFRDAK